APECDTSAQGPKAPPCASRPASRAAHRADEHEPHAAPPWLAPPLCACSGRTAHSFCVPGHLLDNDAVPHMVRERLAPAIRGCPPIWHQLDKSSALTSSPIPSAMPAQLRYSSFHQLSTSSV